MDFMKFPLKFYVHYPPPRAYANRKLFPNKGVTYRNSF